MKIEFVEQFDIPSATAQQRGHGAHGRTWESPGLKAARAAWQALFERHRPPRPLTVPLAIQIILCYHRSGLRDDQLNPRVVRPDLDNLVKVILDALMAAEVIIDDAKVCDLHAVKVEYGGPSMVRFTIEEWEDIK